MRDVSPLGWRSRKAVRSGATSEFIWWRRQGSTARRPSTRRSMRRSTVLTGRSPPLLVREQRAELAPGELAPAVEEGQLDDEGEPDHLGAQALGQADGGRRRPARGEHVVHDQYPLAGLHGVAVDLEQVGAVLELVLLALDLPGELPRLAHGHEPGPEAVGGGGGQDEASGLDPEDP